MRAWLMRLWCRLTGKPVPIWALPEVGKMGIIDKL